MKSDEMKHKMATHSVINPTKRRYNQWVANETLEDFALRYTATRARKWSDARVANTALGIVSFLALEAIGGAITLQYGFTNSVWAIAVVCALIFLFGLPICYHAARSGLDIDLLTRGAGFGYIGSTISSLIYASFTFIFFALEAAIMSMALQLLLGIPLAWGYVISALIVIPLATHGITRISRFQLWTQPLWLLLQLAPLLFILYHHGEAVRDWTEFTGLDQAGEGGFNLLLFGAAAAVIFPLIAQNGEQVDFLRFLPKEQEGSGKWWLALTLAGPGWTLFGVIKLLAGSFLAVLAIQQGVAPELADDPSHMYRVAFSYITVHPEVALVLTATFVIISQLKINVTNAYAGSLAWSNFFSRITHHHPGRIVWLFFNVAIALLLMELGLYQAFENILITYSTLVLAWMGSLVADLVVNRPLGLRPRHMEFKRGRLYDINPVGVGSMAIASLVGIIGQLGMLGPTVKALSPFISLFIPFITAPLIAFFTGGRYYLVRDHNHTDTLHAEHCAICANSFEGPDMIDCPVYGGDICSLCCALDASCRDRCRPKAHLQAQLVQLITRLFPRVRRLPFNPTVVHFLVILVMTSLLIAGLFYIVYRSGDYTSVQQAAIAGAALRKTFLLLFIVNGVLVWLYVLAQDSKRKALDDSLHRADQLHQEVAAHKKTTRQLQDAKEVAVTANQAKSRYLSGVSHELRTPLNTVLGYAQLLKADVQLAARNRKAAEVIHRNGEHLSDVIEGLLEISKIEARRIDILRDEVNLRMLVDQLAETFTVQAQSKNLQFDYQCDADLPNCVLTDEKRLRQILMNLLSNAVKYTQTGKVQFHISYRNEVAKFFVNDTGIGIKEVDRERIYAPFERIQNEETRFVTGTGLGLTISRLLCTLMGGDLSLKSEFGQGSAFTFAVMLPFVYKPTRPVASKQRILGYTGERKRLLVVDDEPWHRALVCDFLTPLGFTLLDAESAQQGLQLAEENAIDLFLLDVRMPLMDGWELAQRLRSRSVDAPIFMLSGNAIETQREELTSRLHNEYLIKPINLESLLEKIGAALNLEWVFDMDAVDASQKILAISEVEESAPQRADLDELISMAKIGYLNGVLEKLDELEMRYSNSTHLRYLKSRAEACDLEGLIRTIRAFNYAT
ncbi:MAG: response regulator [Sedimenticola thiotaurini]|uniref:histidine kinase n=1 Tax=Sedimenticola thiotaurini TaxID=1543721 RepID=A0A558CUM5_9GAMM|nr:MAG: response regulator [Sedimenticola thiotaurini]